MPRFDTRVKLCSLTAHHDHPTKPSPARQIFSVLQIIMKPINRTFIISGGCSGLGLATARDLYEAGAYISLLDLNADAGAELV
jgi:hypothetical protein